MNKTYLFRQVVDFRWRGEYADRDGVRTKVSSFLSRRLGYRTGVQAEATVVFTTEPDTHVDKYVTALRFRRKTSVDWLYYELIPEISWEDQFNFKFNPGIRLRIEIFYDTDAADRYWQQRKKKRDIDGFRW